jgi:elongation factor P hydroxylase
VTPTSESIAHTFNSTFAARFATVMIGGADEPLYLPASGRFPARIFHTHDFAASALHEAAHWCIAGEKRRRLVDYGYGYAPPPRAASDRAAFFALELEAQALESLFASCAGVAFRVSADDFATTAEERHRFASAVARRCEQRRHAVSSRAAAFMRALSLAHRSGSIGVR